MPLAHLQFPSAAHLRSAGQLLNSTAIIHTHGALLPSIYERIGTDMLTLCTNGLIILATTATWVKGSVVNPQTSTHRFNMN